MPQSITKTAPRSASPSERRQKHVQIILTDGFEEIEGIAIIDILRRADIYPFQNETRISNHDGNIFLYVTIAIWTGTRSRFHFGMGIQVDIVSPLKGRQATSFPGVKARMQNCKYSDESVVICAHIIISRGAGTALAFAYTLVSVRTSPALSEKLQADMVYSQ